MKEKRVYLHLAVFDGQGSAARALQQLPRRDPKLVSAVIMEKDAAEHVQFKDVGLTPRKGAVGGIVIGGMIGLLTGGGGLALGALGAVVGNRAAKKKQAKELAPEYLSKVAGSLGPDSSAIIAVSEKSMEAAITAALHEMGAEIFDAIISPEASGQLDDQEEAAYVTLLQALAEKTGGQAKLDVPYRRIHVVVNPVSGQDQPILNVLNRVFYRYGIEWEMSITKQYGDATRFARQAAEAGFDLVAGYGGDGTQHEIANGVMGTGVPMGVLPGGTGNGFGNELGIPKLLEAAVELLCTSHNQRKIDIGELDEGYFVQRLFTGIEPDEQTSRDEKDKYGTFAYLMRDVRRMNEIEDIQYHLQIDGEAIDVLGYKLYVVNSATAGTGMSISKRFAVDDGYLDVFMLSRDRQSSTAALERFFNLDTEKAGMYYWRGKQIEIDAEVDQPVWTDGEYTGRTPVSIKVLPKSLTVAVP